MNSIAAAPTTSPPQSPIARDVRRGLSATRKHLPPYLFYDKRGSALYEQITELPEYYLTRVEREIFTTHADAIIARASRTHAAPLHVIELGAGTATKSQILLSAVVRLQGGCSYVPVDVSRTPLDEAKQRLQRQEPAIHVRPLVMTHERAFSELQHIPAQRLVLFIGSSIANYDDDAAIALLRGVARSISPEGALLLGTDWRKSPAVMVPAYDDAQGVTAAFNKNVLARINRELGASFALDRFEHVAVWNEAASRIEMHLESSREQLVPIRALDMEVRFARGERIHTESSIKYDMPRVEHLLREAGFTRETTYFDAKERFAVHLARVRAPAAL